MKIGFLEGKFAEFDLAQVLQVVGLGRQYTGVEVRRGGRLAGTIFVKSGKVVRAETTDVAGRDAFFKLMREAEDDYFVYRMDTPPNLPEPLGAVSGLLMEAASFSVAPPAAAADIARDSVTEVSVTRNNGAVDKSVVRDRVDEWDGPTRGGVVPQAANMPPSLAPKSAAASTPPTRAAGHAAPPPRPPSATMRAVSLPAPPPRPASAPAGKTAAPSQPVQAKAPPHVADPAPAQPAHDAPPRTQVDNARPQPTIAAQTAAGRVIVVASPKGGCGKTTTALNLSLSLVRQGRSVILVDADINGDVLSSINARERARIGVFDVLRGVASLESALIKTVFPGFQIVCAVGTQLPAAEFLASDLARPWQSLLDDLARRADIVVVDTPAGMYGVTRQVLAASTHVLGVLQAEVVASRSFERFAASLESLPSDKRPVVLGVLLSMLQIRHVASVNVFQGACSSLPAEWLFETSIPRSPAFLDASEKGLPVRHMDDVAPPAVAWLFDNLAAEISERLKLAPTERKPQPLLL